jgi:2-polyprenyl-3-methyl-5-hydroxy-6-metoxy-1,4-benzoquinol methylase
MKTMKIPGSKYRLAEHPRFGFLQVKPTPSPEVITEFYAKEFYSSKYPRCNSSGLDIQLRDKEFYDAGREDVCRNIRELMGRSLKGMDVLDIGCGWGQALLAFKKKGMHCYGFDPAPEGVAYARKKGLDVVRAGMEKMDVFGGKKFDVVTLIDVLEHLSDPIAVLKEIRGSLLKPGGILIIDVPNEFNAFQLAGQKTHKLAPWWVAPPGHLNYFTPATLKKLLRGTGFDVLRAEAAFPLEMFLLFGHKYIGDGKLGRECHQQRMNFERNLRKHGYGELLRKFYRSLAELELGRKIVVYSRAARAK